MRFGKTNALLNLISHKSAIDKTYLYAKGLYESKYQLVINKCKGVGLNHYNNSKGFIDPNEEHKILIVDRRYDFQ